MLLDRETNYRVCAAASFLAASCNSWVSTSSAGSWTQRTTDPRMKQFLTDNYKQGSSHPFNTSLKLIKSRIIIKVRLFFKLTMCGYLSGSVTLISVSLMLRYWSTECKVPQILKQVKACLRAQHLKIGLGPSQCQRILCMPKTLGEQAIPSVKQYTRPI